MEKNGCIVCGSETPCELFVRILNEFFDADRTKMNELCFHCSGFFSDFLREYKQTFAMILIYTDFWEPKTVSSIAREQMMALLLCLCERERAV